MEEILNVIGERKYSDEELKEVANKVYDKRAEKFHKEVNKLDKITGDTNPDKFTRVQQYRANKQAEKVERAQDRLQHAEEVAQLSKKDALRRFYAADKTNEAYELMEEILFELDLENKQSISPNKIKKTKKDENGEKVEVVSVADELFPYEGDAKQQFNQKILAKINDMIEGTGSLEDLIQFVRRGVGNKKVANECLDEAVDVLEDLRNQIIRKRYPSSKEDELMVKLGDLKYKENQQLFSGERHKEVDYDRPSLQHYSGTAFTNKSKEKYVPKNMMKTYTGIEASGRRETKNEAGEKVTNNRSNRLGGAFSNKSDEDKIKASVERHNKKVAHECLSEAIAVLEDIHDAIRKSNKSAKEKSELSMKAMTTQGKELVDTAKREGKLATDIMVKRSPYNTKNANGERHTNTRRERTSFDNNCDLKTHESTISERKNIFGHEEGNRGDLIDDVSQTVTGKTLNQHIENTANKVAKPVKTEDKIKKVGEAFELMEEIINEVSVKKWKEAAKNSIEGRRQEQDDNDNEYRYFSGKIPVKQQKQLDKEYQERDNKLSDRTARAEYLKQNLPDSKKSASKVMSAAKKSTEDRTKKTDNLRTEYNKTKDNETAIDHNVSLAREKHARMISGKHETPGDAITTLADFPYKEANKRRAEKVEKAWDKYEKADNKPRGFAPTNKEKAAEEVRQAQKDLKNNTTRRPKKGL
jgi:hypothetical protein